MIYEIGRTERAACVSSGGLYENLPERRLLQDTAIHYRVEGYASR
jgi:hypothetical protein